MQFALRQTSRRSQKERTEETRARLIDATIEALLEVGAAGTTVSEICRRAEVTSGALHHHFGSKGGLMAAVVRRLFSPFAGKHERFGTAAPMKERIGRLIDDYWSIYGGETYFVILEILLESRHDDELMAMTAHYREKRLDQLRAYLHSDFPDVDLPDEEKLRIVHRMLDYLRGSAVRRIYESGPKVDQEIREQASAMVEGPFGSALRGREKLK